MLGWSKEEVGRGVWRCGGGKGTAFSESEDRSWWGVWVGTGVVVSVRRWCR